MVNIAKEVEDQLKELAARSCIMDSRPPEAVEKLLELPTKEAEKILNSICTGAFLKDVLENLTCVPKTRGRLFKRAQALIIFLTKQKGV